MTKLPFLISCQEAAHRCDKAQYNEVSTLEKLSLQVHLLFCSLCKKYSRKNKQLTVLLQSEDFHSLEESKKQQLKKVLAASKASQQTS